jgi:ribosomal protein S18 acetylase RimI-like enzyme
MNGYRVVEAVPEDGKEFCRISRSVAYVPGAADGRRGFLVFQGTAEEYAERIAGSPGSVIAYDAAGVPAGFLLTAREEPGGVLVDQIGVAPAAAGAGVAQMLLDMAVALTRPRVMRASILQEPVRNLRSIRFFSEKNGFRLQRTYREDGFVWGIYERHY